MARYLLVAVMLVVLPGANGWAQGSKTGQKHVNISAVQASGTIVIDSDTEKRLREHMPGARHLAQRIEFRDENGKSRRVIEKGHGNIEAIHIPPARNLVVVQEGGLPKRYVGDIRTIVRAYNLAGEELWNIRMCCDSGDSYDRVYISDGGEIVAITDAGEGEACPEGYGGSWAPAGCYGLRVFTAEGENILNEKHGLLPALSAHGSYIIFLSRDIDRWKILETETGRIDVMPGYEYGTPTGPRENGLVPYWDPNKRKYYEYRFGQGINEVPPPPQIKKERP